MPNQSPIAPAIEQLIFMAENSRPGTHPITAPQMAALSGNTETCQETPNPLTRHTLARQIKTALSKRRSLISNSRFYYDGFAWFFSARRGRLP